MPIKLLFILIALLSLFPFVPSAAALVAGILFVFTFGNPFETQTVKLSKKLLALSIVGLGAGMNLSAIWAAGSEGLAYTVLSISFALVMGGALGRLLKVNGNISSLITFGSAICGGSAIAALAPVIKAKEHEITVALGVVFTLNALALVIFPFIGDVAGLTQEQFGLWAALAIHDTSSVVGASMQYGAEALEVGTTVKLVRALWIIPLVFVVAFWVACKEKSENGTVTRIKLPWFILGFVAMAALVTFVPVLQPAGDMIAFGAKRLLVLTLFLIGAGLSREALKQVGLMPFVQGTILWGIITAVSLIVIGKFFYAG